MLKITNLITTLVDVVKIKWEFSLEKERVVKLDNVSDKDILSAIEEDIQTLLIEIKAKEKALNEKNFLSKVLKWEKVEVERLDFGSHFIQNFQLFFMNIEKWETKKVSWKIKLENPSFDKDFLIENFSNFFEEEEEEEEEYNDWCEVGNKLKVFCSHCGH